jgi:RNA-directed DNA polymerase
VAQRISDGRVLQLVDSWLSQDIMSGLQRWTPSSGTPQGAVLSPLLANCYLHPLDVHMAASGWQMVRYADDFVVLCTSEQQAQEALQEVQAWVQANGLKLHPDKTRIGDCRQAGQGFDFLGYRFECGRRWVRKKSMQKLRDRIRGLTPRSGGHSLKAVLDKLNPVLRGWWGYFKHAHYTTFRDVDGFVRRRLRSILRQYNGLRARSSGSFQDHRRWANSFFAEQGLFTLTAARAAASQSR